MARRRGSIEQRTSEGTRRVKRGRRHFQQKRTASVAAGKKGDECRGHGPPKGGSASAAAEAGTVGYGSDDRRGRSGRVARRRRCQPL